MGWLKRFLQNKPEQRHKPPQRRKEILVTENLIQRYCKKRYEIESLAEVDESEYRRFKRLESNIESAGYDVDQLYKKFIAERRSMPAEESEALDVAEEIFQEPTKSSKKTAFKSPKKDEEFTSESEEQAIGPDGDVNSIVKEIKPVAACGKKLSSKDEIAGFCDECNKAVCSEHIKHCVGHANYPCQKLLCPKHTFYFPDQDGNRQPCCEKHYTMKFFLQENPLDAEPISKDKPKKSLEND